MDMSLVSAVSDAQTATIGARIGYAVTDKIMETTADLQRNMIDKLLGSVGIGNNLNVVG
jgi:hypothetical protein